MRTIDYLDAARSRAGLPSDYALAKRLAVKPSAVSNWRNGRAVPEPLVGYHLAELAQAEPLRVLADLELERAERGHRDDAAAGWRSILQRIGGAAAAVAMVAGLGAVPSPSQAMPAVDAGNGCALCQTRRRRQLGSRAVMAALTRALLGSPFRTA